MRVRAVLSWLAVAAFLLPALLITVARATDLTGRLGIALVSLTPLALPLYAVVLVLGGLRLALRRRWRGSALPVALVAVAGLVVHGWWYAPQVTGGNPPPADGATPLVVMTANVFAGTADGIALVRRVSDAHADLLVVPEITAHELDVMDRAGLADLLPYRVGEPASEAGATDATMAFSREPVSDVSRISTEQDSWRFRSGDLVVLAVHAFSPNEPGLWRDDHAAIAAAVAATDPDLVVGDFNATADHAPMRHLAAEGYRDVGELANVGWEPTWPAQTVRRIPGIPVAQIDHVLVGHRLAALGLDTVAIPGTDHRAVVARVAPK